MPRRSHMLPIRELGCDPAHKLYTTRLQVWEGEAGRNSQKPQDLCSLLVVEVVGRLDGELVVRLGELAGGGCDALERCGRDVSVLRAAALRLEHGRQRGDELALAEAHHDHALSRAP